MSAESDFYIERPSDAKALGIIRRQGETLIIKGPRQMGKSSLLMRTIAAAADAGKRVALLDFQLIERAALADASRFFREFCVLLSDELDLDDRTEQYWGSPLGNVMRCTRYLGRYVLKDLDRPVVLAIDEVEGLFDADFRADFFAMLRAWHNDRRGPASSVWSRLDLVLVTSTEPYQLIENLNESPFNVGVTIELEDFSPEQVAELNGRHGLPLDPRAERRLIALLGGHPYLVRRALYLIASNALSADDLFASATEDRGPFGDHLRHHLFRLYEKPEAIAGFRQIIRSGACHDERLLFRLQSAGLVRKDGRDVQPRCQLYAEYFRERLVG